MFKKAKIIGLLSLLGVAACTTGAFALVWLYAPEVGGAWWPYIRFAISFFASIIVGKIALVVAQIAIVSVLGKEVLHGKGGRDNPFNEEDVDEFFEQFE
jgi:hypothetical protein